VSGRQAIALLAFALAASFSVSAQAQMDHARPPSGPAGSAAPFGSPVEDERVFYHFLFSQLEGRLGIDQSLRWEGEGWAGTDLNRIWLKTEGTLTNGQLDDGQQELFYSRAISTYFDAQIGARYDLDSLARRGWIALGVEGLAPGSFQVAATGYVGGNGRLAAKLEGSVDLLITQRLILQPQVEMNIYSQDDPERGIGAGFSDIDAGLRLRYEITRKFAPYVGVTYNGKFGHTADFARAAGAPVNEIRVAVGLRVWY
jgi:copper resistance protein B